MAQSLTHEQSQQVFHLAQMAILAMCARSFASAEFATSPEVASVQFVLSRTESINEEKPFEVQFIDRASNVLGAMSL
jgi:hypothetical protein